MQVRCQDTSGCALTYGKAYAVIRTNNQRHYIINDSGKEKGYYIYRFQTLKGNEAMSQSKLNCTILPNSIVINCAGKNWNLHKNDGRFAVVLQAIKDNKLEDIPKLLDVSKVY